jgi:hypothetical protein
MGRRLDLPLFRGLTASHPRSIDAVRASLGGREESGRGVGDPVRVPLGEGTVVGVILFARGDTLSVVFDDAVVRSVARDRAEIVPGAELGDLARLAESARAFAAVREGDRVRFVSGDGTAGAGTLAEKCRFGALVVRDDGVVMGVGFRSLRPLD